MLFRNAQRVSILAGLDFMFPLRVEVSMALRKPVRRMANPEGR